jgi:HSP20 family protein
MLMRFDPFSDLDRLSRQVWGNTTRTNSMPADAYRKEDRLYLPSMSPGSTPIRSM